MNQLVKAGEIRLFGTIVKDEWIWPADVGLFSAAMVIDALSAFDGDVTIIVNSDGGMPSEGEAIRAAIAAHPGKVTARVTGNAHSAASLMIMSADKIEMSAGSLMLVHDPSSGAYGNPAALSAAADELDTMADAYAEVYAARAGISADEARAIMRAETMYSASAAVAAGFADDVIREPVGTADDATMRREMALGAVNAAIERAHAAQMKFEARERGHDATGQEPKDGVQTMTKPETAAPAAPAPAVATPAPAAAPAMQDPAPAPAAAPVMSAAEMMAADKPRRDAIRAARAPFMAHVPQSEVDRMIDEGVPLDEANRIIMRYAAAAQPRIGRVEIQRDETETRIEGMIGALMHRANPAAHKLEGPAMDYRGLRVKTLAMHLGGGGGFNEIDAIRAGLRSTSMMSGAMGVSDFAYITAEVMNRSLRAAYERRAATWRRISRQRSATDFRELHSVIAGGDFELKATQENGEYLQSTVTDGAQGLKLAKYGRQINLTFEAIVDDNMGVFERLPGDFARAAGTLESKLAWSGIRSNAKVGDGKALFHADHGNKSASAGAISVDTVGAGRKAMWEQRPAGAVDKDDFIAVSPDLLFVPPALETKAGQFVAASVPTQMSEVNPFASTLTPVIEPALGAAAGGSDSKWYLFASDLPVLEHAYLDGYEAPTVVTKEGMNPDGVNMVARHIFAAVPVEYRGAYLNG